MTKSKQRGPEHPVPIYGPRRCPECGAPAKRELYDRHGDVDYYHYTYQLPPKQRQVLGRKRAKTPS